MLTIDTVNQSTAIASEMDTEELLYNLGRFPARVLPVGVLRELQSRGQEIHDALVASIRQAMDTVLKGRRHKTKGLWFSIALLVPLATSDDRPLIETLATLPSESIDYMLGDLASEALPDLIARFFKQQNSTEVLEWIDRLSDHPELHTSVCYALNAAMTKAVVCGDLDRTTAIDAFSNRLKKRANQRFDTQSAQIINELMNLTASNPEAVDVLVRSCFERGQVDTEFVGISDWNNVQSHSAYGSSLNTWLDTTAILSTWNYSFVSESLDPVNAQYRFNANSRGWASVEQLSVHELIDQLRRSTDGYCPLNAVQSLGYRFAQAYDDTLKLIREEMARYERERDRWSGNGAYLGLVVTVAERMPLPVDLLEAILQMQVEDREQLFGDQFELIVRAVALTPLHQTTFVEQWIWDDKRIVADRRDMVGFYRFALCNRTLGYDEAIDALVAGLRRALQDEPLLIAPFAEHLALLAPMEHSGLLDEAFARSDANWMLPLEDLRRMATDEEFAEIHLKNESFYYQSEKEIIASGVMFDRAALEEKPRRVPTPAAFQQLQPNIINQASQQVLAKTTIRNDVRVQRNAPCPCGSGKKYKKCCLNK